MSFFGTELRGKANPSMGDRSGITLMDEAQLAVFIERVAKAAAEAAIAAMPRPGLRPPCVTMKQAAAMLHVSPPTIKRYVEAGKIRLNNMGMVPIEQVDRLLDL